MMVVRVRVARDQLEARRAVAEVEALHHTHAFEQVHGAVDGREVAVTLRQRGVDFLVRHRVPMLAQQREDGLARPGDALGLLPQPRSQVRQRFGRVIVRVGVGLLHGRRELTQGRKGAETQGRGLLGIALLGRIKIMFSSRLCVSAPLR